MENYYRESLNFPVFRKIGEHDDPFCFETPAEYLSLGEEYDDGTAAEKFFFNILTICKGDLKEDYELFRILAIMRKVGIHFVPNAKFGYVIKPNDGGVWQKGEYDDVKWYLNKYQEYIIRALAEAAK
jgi:hypothetical protein